MLRRRACSSGHRAGVHAAPERPPDAERLAAGLQPLTGLLEGKYWVDEVYDAVIVRPLAVLAKWFFAVDRVVFDTVVWFVGFVPQLSGSP